MTGASGAEETKWQWDAGYINLQCIISLLYVSYHRNKGAHHVWTPSPEWAWPLWMHLGESVWRRDQQRERNTGGFLWLSPAWRGRETQIKEEKINKKETKNSQSDRHKKHKRKLKTKRMKRCQKVKSNQLIPPMFRIQLNRCVLPVVSDSGSLHEAGCIGLFEQLLCVGHQARVLQQASPLWDLGRQGLLPPAAGSLQGQSQSPLALSYGRSQLTDTVGQLMQSHCAVRLETETERAPQRAERIGERVEKLLLLSEKTMTD